MAQELDSRHFLVGNNCVAIHCSRQLGLPNQSPFAWAFTCPDDFVRIMDNWDRMDWGSGPDIHTVTSRYMDGYYGGEFPPVDREFYWEGIWHDTDGNGYPVLYPHLDLGTEAGRETLRRRTDRMLSLMEGGAAPHFCLACDNSTSAHDWPADRVQAFRERDNASIVWFGDTSQEGKLRGFRTAEDMMRLLVSNGIVRDNGHG